MGAYYYAQSPVSAYTTFGTGCIGSNGPPRLEPNQLPRIGKTFSVLLLGLPIDQPGLGFFGTSRTNWGLLPLPLALDPIGMQGCKLWVSGEVSYVIQNTGPHGVLAWSLPGAVIPANTALIGSKFYNQAIIVDPQANPAGLVATNGGEGVIGN
jgi:hypothetical protein